MVKILLADTEPDYIKGIKDFVLKTFPDTSVAVSMDPEMDILGFVKEAGPDLIFMDIRFFGIKSNELIRDIYERYPHIRFIIYGNYNDAEYMKRSLEFGVIDYIFKPVKHTDIQRSLLKAIEYFNKLEKQQKLEQLFTEGYKKNTGIFENIFLTNLINGNIRNNEEIRESLDYFNLDLQPPYRVLVIRIDHFKKVILTLEEQEKQLLSYKIFHMVKAGLGEMNFKAHLGSLNAVTVILSGEQRLSEVIGICENIKNAVFESISVKVTVGIGRAYDLPSEIGISFKEADAALRYRFSMGYNSVIPIDFAEPSNNVTYRYPLEKEEKLVYTAVAGEYDYCMQLLTEIFDALRLSEPLPEKLIPKIITDILISISRFASEQNLPVSSQITTFFPSKEVFELTGPDQAFKYLAEALKGFCDYIINMKNENSNNLIEGVKRYISEKYYESFNLIKIANSLQTTPEYLNKIFKDREKKTVFELVLETRMEQAKKLMLTTNFDDDIIAIKVGYDDTKHFKSVFKNQEGISVKQFRTSHKLD